MNKLRDEITEIIRKARIQGHDEGISSGEYVDQILVLIKEAGYVQVKQGDIYWSKEERSRPDPTKGYYKE